MAVKLTFPILSVLDFMESSKDWSMDVFESNVVTLKNELKDIECEDTSNPYYPCRKEIEHLIGFLRKLLYFNQYGGAYPTDITKEDYNRIKEVIKRYRPDIEWL